MNDLKRREFLKASAAFAAASAAGGFGCVEIASAQPIQVPTIDKLTMRVLIDQAHDHSCAAARSKASFTRALAPDVAPMPVTSFIINGACRCSWNRSAIRSSVRFMLDFGYTPRR